MFNISQQLIDFIIEEAKTIQKIPSPTFQEEQRGIYIKNRLETITNRPVVIDSAGNVLLNFSSNEKGKKSLLISAHLDTVFSESVDLTLSETAKKITGPGIGDNSLGVAMIIAISKILSSQVQKLNFPIVLMANVCEEGLGDLRGMRTYFSENQDLIHSSLVLEGFGFGSIVHRGLGAKRFRITAHTQGGHSWGDAGAASAIQIISEITNQIYSIKLSKKHKTTVNVGIIQGGQSINTIAPKAHIDIDLRSVDSTSLSILEDNVKDICHTFDHLADTEVTIEKIGDRPAGEISSSHPLVKTAIKSYQLINVEPKLTIASTDANIPLSLDIPSICVGITKGKFAHSMDETIYLEPILNGVKSIFSIIELILLSTRLQ